MSRASGTAPAGAAASALKLSLLYLVFGSLWITLSDRALLMIPGLTAERLTWLSMYKGWAFILVTSGLLYMLVRRRLTILLQFQEALGRSEQRYRQLLETAEEGIWTVDAQARTTFVNQKMASMLGYTVEEMLGRPVTDFMEEQAARQAMENLGRQLSGIRGQYDLRYRRKDGSDLWAIVSATPIEDDSGTCTGALAMVTDITARKHAESQLAETEAKYRCLVEQSLVGVYLIQDGRFAYVNPRLGQIFGYTPEDIVQNRTVADLTAPASRALVEENLRRRLSGQVSSVHYTFRGLRRDGTEFDCEVLGSATTYQGRPAVIGSLLDVTERTRATEALRESEQRYRALFTGMLNGCLLLEVLPDASGRAADFRVLDVNPAFERMMHLGRSEMIGRTMRQVMPDLDAGWRAILGLVAATGRAAHFEKLAGHLDRYLEVTAYRPVPGQVALTCLDVTQQQKAEQALRESEHRFRLIFENAANLIVSINRSGVLVDCNPRVREVLGYAREEVLGQSLARLLHPGDRAGVLTELEALFALGQKCSREFRMIRKDGREIDVRLSAAAIRDVQNRAVHVIGIIEDVTERKRTEQVIHKLATGISSATGEEFFRSLVEQLATTLHSDYAWVGEWREQEPRKIRTVAVWAQGKLGDNFQYDLANSPCEVVIGRRMCCHPERVREAFPQARFLAEASAECYIGTPLFDSAGNSIGILAVADCRPCAEAEFRCSVLRIFAVRAAAELERRRSEEALRLTQFAVDRAADALFFLDSGGQFVYVNEAASHLLGYTREELLSMALSQIDPEYPPEIWLAHFRELKQRGHLVFQSHYRAKDGRRIPVEITANYLEFGDKSLECAFARDVTERKRMEQQLLQSQKMEAIGRLAGGISHDFNNLLAVISGYAESLQRRLEPASPLRTSAQEIARAAERGASLVNQLLTFSRRQSQQHVPVDLNSIVQSLRQMLRHTMDQRVTVLVRCEEHLRTVSADPVHLEQVLMNLVLNARDAMPQGGKLLIATANADLDEPQASALGVRPGPYIRLTVSDTGIGMDEHLQQHIFEPFFTTKEGKGSGLGLSIVYGIAQQYGGTVTVDSRPEAGATFEVLLPACCPPIQPGQEADQPVGQTDRNS